MSKNLKTLLCCILSLVFVASTIVAVFADSDVLLAIETESVTGEDVTAEEVESEEVSTEETVTEEDESEEVSSEVTTEEDESEEVSSEVTTEEDESEEVSSEVTTEEDESEEDFSEVESEEVSEEAPEVHEHDFVGVVTTEPTCTEDGVMTYTCACGETYDEPIAATGHNGVWEIVYPAEIGVDGLKQLVCADCGEILDEEVIPAIEDVSEEVSEDASEETSTEEDESEEDSSEVESEEVSEEAPEVHEHDFVGVVTTEPTCTEDGVMTYTCACGETYNEVIEATGHNGVWEIVKEAEIGVEGLKQLVCTVCGAVLDEEVIPAIEDVSEEVSEDASEEASEENTTAEVTTAETTTDEVTTAETSTDEVTTAETSTDEITTAETSTDEVTTAETSTDEVTTVDTPVKSRLGDVDLNGKITAADARLALRISAKLEPTATAEQLYAAEVTGDGTIEAKDARRILRVSAKLDKESDFGKDIDFPIQ